MAKSEQTVDAVQAAQVKGDKEIAAGYTGAVVTIEKAEAILAALKEDLRAQGVAAGENGEERRRVHERAVYELEQVRQVTRDRHAREDAEREADFKKRDQALTDAETALLVTLKVNVPEGEPVPRVLVIREALAKVVADAEKAAAAKATAEAQARYATQKQIDDAQAEKVNALLRQENEQLKAQNARLTAQNDALTAAAQKAVNDMKEVASGAFQAAGGVVNQGNAALTSAASASGRTLRG